MDYYHIKGKHSCWAQGDPIKRPVVDVLHCTYIGEGVGYGSTDPPLYVLCIVDDIFEVVGPRGLYQECIGPERAAGLFEQTAERMARTDAESRLAGVVGQYLAGSVDIWELRKAWDQTGRP